MALQALVSSLLSATRSRTTPNVRTRTNIATQVVRNRGINTRANASVTVSTGRTTARISTSGGRIRVNGSTRIGRTRINFGF